MTYKAAVLGASGYTGAELVRLISTHPQIEIAALSADRKAGMAMSDVFAQFRHLDLPGLQRIEDIDLTAVDLVFCALPHGTSQPVIQALPRDVRIIDLSADFRLRDAEAYARWYGKPHVAPELQREAVYGLTEFYRDAIAKARFVAGTGCNAATGQYALRPLVAAGVIDLGEIIVDLKAAMSGAGRSPKELLLLAEGYENVTCYSTGGTHRHLGEFDQELSAVAGRPVEITLMPHLLPASRGIMVTCYLKGEADAVYDALAQTYRDEPFIQVLPLGATPAMKDVRGSNFCHIGVVADRADKRTIVVAVLDNLTKGSSGQALQNANLMLGIPETEGLTLAPVFP
ncbi:MAG: N-acetyl-gamma-glutamyl-phosphate reductase [Pseudomonadota bacterium]